MNRTNAPKREHMASSGNSDYLTGAKSNRSHDMYSWSLLSWFGVEINFLFDFGQTFKENNDTGQYMLRTGLAGRLKMEIDWDSAPGIIIEWAKCSYFNERDRNKHFSKRKSPKFHLLEEEDENQWHI